MKLSIIVPVFNERRWIEFFWSQLQSAPIASCSKIDSVEIVVVDDGSTDGTADVLRKLTSTHFSFAPAIPCTIQLKIHPQNFGKGRAVRDGIDASTGDIILIQDADCEYSVQDYSKLLPPIIEGRADAVFGSRFTGQERRLLYFWHAAVNKTLTFCANILFNLNMTDVETGFKAFRGDVGRALNLKSDRFGIEIELAAKLARTRGPVFEVPISYAGRTYEEGKKIKARDGLAALYHLIRFGLFDTEPFKPGLMQTLHALEQVSSVIYAPLLRKALNMITFRGSTRPQILEIGAGIGSLTKELVKIGDVAATDLSDDFVAILKRRFTKEAGFRALTWDATKPWSNSTEKYDLIVAFNVLEHLEDDRAALDLWQGLLSDQGKIVILVPHLQSLFSPLDSIAGHYRRYCRKDLVTKLRGSSLIERNVYFGNFLGMAGWYVNAVLMKRTTLPAGQLRLYAIFKTFFGRLEKILDRISGLSLIIVSERATKNSAIGRT